jgi:RNA polymerase II elongation factor ELL
MAGFSIPPEGLSFSNPHTANEENGGPTQVVRLDLLENKTQTLLNALKSGKKVVLQTGKTLAISHGDKRVVLQTVQDPYPSDFYTTSRNGKTLHFLGKQSHALEVRQAKEATEKADAALANLENSLKSLKEERAQNEVGVLHNKDEIKMMRRKDHKPSPLSNGMRKDHLLGASARSMPSSPHINSSRSPLSAPTSAPATGGFAGSTSKDKLRLEAIRIPLIHLLASRPLSSKSVMDKLRAPKEDCDRILDKYAKDSVSAPGKKELKEKTYKDLDVWKFPYGSDDDRKAAIERAIHAFDRLRLEKSDPLWQQLLEPSERGKGKSLSRLNLNKPPPASSLLKPDQGDASGYKSDREGSKSPGMKAHKGPAPASKSKSRPASPAPPKKRDLSHARAQAEGKFKSSERIEDSDEEAEGVDVVPAKPNASIKKQSSPSGAHVRTLSPKKQVHKSNLSHSSSGSDSSDNQKSGKSLKPPSRDHEVKQNRPRHDSSPQKPSPLGSSPPATSTDFDSSSSGKQSQSSAPSSPPSSTDMPIAKQKQKYSPVISERTRDVSRGRPPVKRRSDEHEDIPPAKRQQVNGVHPTTKAKEEETKETGERPPVERKWTDSSSASEKGPPGRDEVMDEAKRFQLYYKKYKDLHERLESKPEKERDEKDMENLLNMHKRLKEMKTEIWDNWHRVEKATFR